MKTALMLFTCCIALSGQATEAQLRRALEAKTGAVSLPAGTIEISREIAMAADVHDLDIRGAKTILKASDTFRGRALLVLTGGKNVKIHDLEINGNRESTGRMIGAPPSGTMYSRFMPNNGILAENVAGIEIYEIKAKEIAGFTILLNASRNARVHEVEITLSGGFNTQRRNNGAGGILLEEGSADFEVRQCLFGGMRGNGITVRASDRGRIEENEFSVVGRNAIQISQANGVTIENNRARQIGSPTEEVEGQPLCINLDRFNDGAVSGNTCTDELSGAISIAGSRNRIAGNHLLRLNLAQREAAGIFVAAGSTGNTIEGNEITGYGMGGHCVGGASGANVAAANRISKNDCSDDASIARQTAMPASLAIANALLSQRGPGFSR